MKRLIIFLLMMTIQITFMDKVIASVTFVETQTSSSMHYEGMRMMKGCANTMKAMENCSLDCDMMTVISVVHFIEDEQEIHFHTYQLNYPIFMTSPPQFLPTSLYRPPLYS